MKQLIIRRLSFIPFFFLKWREHRSENLIIIQISQMPLTFVLSLDEFLRLPWLVPVSLEWQTHRGVLLFSSLFSIGCNNENTATTLECFVSDIYVYFRPLQCTGVCIINTALSFYMTSIITTQNIIKQKYRCLKLTVEISSVTFIVTCFPSTIFCIIKM